MEKNIAPECRRILLIGNANSKWVMRYIRKMYSEHRTVTLINDAQLELQEKQSFYEYYQEQNIKVITINDSNLYTRSLKCVALVNQMEDFDVCHIMFMSQYASLVATMCENKCKRMVANFFGTDFYKASIQMRQEQKMLLNVADSIIVTIDKMKNEVIDMYPEFQEKTHTVYFESQVLNILKNNIVVAGDIETVINGLEQDRIVIAAGYKGGEHQQHELFIHALNACDKTVRDKITVIFMMTYGLTEEYEQYVSSLLKQADFSYVIVKEFLSDEQMVLLRRRVDIFVNTVLTDAFNAAIQESLYCETVVLCGNWLNYPQLKQEDAYVVGFDDIKELTYKLEDVVRNLDVYKKESARNRAVIERIDSKRKHIENWSSFYRDIRYNHSNSNPAELFIYLVDNAKKLNDRNHLYREAMELWLKAKLNGISPIHTWLSERQWKKVIIYGAGTLGEMVYQEIQGMGIQVTICDSSAEKTDWFEKCIVRIENLKEIDADGVIVTPLHVYKEIERGLTKLFDEGKIVSLIDMLKEH